MPTICKAEGTSAYYLEGGGDQRLQFVRRRGPAPNICKAEGPSAYNL
jgi:hypothetical protein